MQETVWNARDLGSIPRTGRSPGDAEAKTPILWPPDAKRHLVGKDLMLGKIEGMGFFQARVLEWGCHCLLHKVCIEGSITKTPKCQWHLSTTRVYFSWSSWFYVVWWWRRVGSPDFIPHCHLGHRLLPSCCSLDTSKPRSLECSLFSWRIGKIIEDCERGLQRRFSRLEFDPVVPPKLKGGGGLEI